MAKFRPLGVTFFAIALTFIGGFLTLILFSEILASISFLGIESVLITNINSLGGFVIYGVVPIIFYITGIGLFTIRPWAPRSILFIIPPLMFLSFFNLACGLAQSRNNLYLFHVRELITYSPEPFLLLFILYVLLILPMIIYFRNPFIISYFNKSSY